MRRTRTWALAALLAAGLGVAALGVASCRPVAEPPVGDTAGPPVVGQPAPSATFKLVATGEIINVPADTMGKPFALLFFSYG